MTIAACALTAAPAMAQSSYGGGGGSYRNQPSVDSNAKRLEKAQKKADKRARKQAEAMRKKEQMEKDLMIEEAAMKEDAMKADAMKADKMAPAATSYGSGATAKPMSDTMQKAGSHGSSTGYKSDAMMKDDAMMKEDAMKDTKSYGSGTAVGKPANCPTGTTPQNNGTCMLNGS